MVKTFDEWFLSQQGTQYFSYYDFAKEAWEAAQAAEREACAKVCVDESYKGQSREVGALACSKSIRARWKNGK